MQPIPRTAVARVAIGVVSIAVALMLLAFCLVVPLQANQAARLAADSGKAKPCAVSTLCTCQSNEKQLSLALLQYYQDYDEKFPSGTQQVSESAPLSGVGWAGQVYSYVKATAPFKCPNDPTTATAPLYPISYALNSNTVGLSQAALIDPSVTPELFEISADAVEVTQYDEGASTGATRFSAAGDGTDLRLFAGRDASLNPSVLYATGPLGNRPKSNGLVSQEPSTTGRHLGGSNLLFTDGHAHWYLPGDVSSGTDAQSLDALQMGTTNGSAAGVDAPPFQVSFTASKENY